MERRKRSSFRIPKFAAAHWKAVCQEAEADSAPWFVEGEVLASSFHWTATHGLALAPTQPSGKFIFPRLPLHLRQVEVEAGGISGIALTIASRCLTIPDIRIFDPLSLTPPLHPLSQSPLALTVGELTVQ